MRVEWTDHDFTVTLSRRNLLTLLAKLDGHPKNSGSAISQYVYESDETVLVNAEEDDVHYRGRVPGSVHPDTEMYIGDNESRK